MPSHSLLPDGWSVPQVFRDRLGDEVGRQRAMLVDGHVLLVLHKVPDVSDLDRFGRFFWREPDGTWHANGEGTGIDKLARHVATYEDAIRGLENKEEAARNASDYFAILKHIVPLRRASRLLHVALQQVREYVPDDHDLIRCRDEAGSVERSAELVAAEAQSGLEYAMALQAERQADHSRAMAISSHRLNRLVAIFFPIATVATVFGANLKFGFEEAYFPVPFWVMVGSTILLGLILNMVMMSKPVVSSSQ